MTSKRAQSRKAKARGCRRVLTALGFSDGVLGLEVVRHDLHNMLIANPDTVGPVQFHVSDDPAVIATWISAEDEGQDSVGRDGRPMSRQTVTDYYQRARQFIANAEHPYAVLATRRGRDTTPGGHCA